MQLRKATRQQAKLRIGISAASGYGKTYSALLLAKGLVGDWGKIALIDTENGSGDLYEHLGEYNVLSLVAPYSPERYIEAIRTCEAAGMEAIIIDSTTHEWDGEGGCLDIQNKMGGRYQDWAKVTPRHNAFIQAILQSPAHVITTVRRKQDYEMSKDSGKVKVEKKGLKEVQREGFEYELTLSLHIDTPTHLAEASKDRTGLFDGNPAFVITEETGKSLKEWAEQGAPAPVKTSIVDAINEAKASISSAEITAVWKKYPEFHGFADFKSEVARIGKSFKEKEVANVSQ